MPATTTRPTTTMAEMSFGAAPEPQPSLVMVEDRASTAVAVREISQPSVAIQLNAAGTLAPSTPKVARVITMVGALPRLPAMEIMPTSRNDTTTPMMVMMVACQKEIPNPRAHAPYDMANMEMFAANQGQNMLAGVPLRSSSEIVSMPCSSTARAPLSLLIS